MKKIGNACGEMHVAALFGKLAAGELEPVASVTREHVAM